MHYYYFFNDPSLISEFREELELLTYTHKVAPNFYESIIKIATGERIFIYLGLNMIHILGQSNSLGMSARYLLVEDIWADLPKLIRDLFLRNLNLFLDRRSF